MANNITAKANTGTGTDVLATLDLGGVHLPKALLTDSTGAAVELLSPLVHGATAGTPKGIVALGIRQDTAGSPVANGQLQGIQINEDGRVKVASAPAQYTAVTGNITANAQSVSVDVTACSNLVIHCTGTFAGANCAFEGSIDGGTTWFGVQGVRSNANTIETSTGVLAAAPAYSWELSVNAYTNFRVRATAFTSGNQAWRFTLGTYATEPIPAIQTHPVTQSGTWNIGTVTTVSAATITPAAASAYFLNTAATTNAAVVKASAGSLYELTASNPTATEVFWKLYNKTTAPTVGTDVPVLTVRVPANSTAAMDFGTMGKRFTTGISSAVTALQPVADTTAVPAGIQVSATYV